MLIEKVFLNSLSQVTWKGNDLILNDEWNEVYTIRSIAVFSVNWDPCPVFPSAFKFNPNEKLSSFQLVLINDV